MSFSKSDINLDVQKETDKIVNQLKDDVFHKLKKRGAVVGISGGIDSSVILGLCVHAFGPKRVVGIMMPEHDSNPDSLELAKSLADKFGMEYVVENTTVKVSLNPEDFNRFKEVGLDSQSLLEGRNRIQLVEDPGISEGGCLLTTGFGEVDVTLEHRRTLLYDAIEQAFMAALAEDRSGQEG